MGFKKRSLINKDEKDSDKQRFIDAIPAGELRKSQIITTFGPGAIVDLEKFSGIIASAHYWEQAYKEQYGNIPENAKIHDKNLEHLLGVRYFLAPKTEDTDNPFGNYKPSKDVIAYRFPYIHFCPNCGRLGTYWELGDGSCDYLTCRHCGKKYRLVPSRFVIACVNGHIEDFPFNWWVHRGKNPENHKLKVRFDNASGGLESIIIHCDTCGKERSMDGCMTAKNLAGYLCKGKRPWGGKTKKVWEDGCKAPMHTLQRSASNVYYSVLRSALTIPEYRDQFYQILDDHPDICNKYDIFKNLPDEQLRMILEMTDLGQYIENHDLTMPEIKEKMDNYSPAANTYKDLSYEKLRENEYDALCGDDTDDEYFRTEATEVPKEFTSFFKKIVKVHKLREVMALVGFRRVLSLDPTDENNKESGELKDFDFGRHPKGYIEPSIEPVDWLPGINLYGEGIFFQINADTLEEWEKQVHGHYNDMYNRIPTGSSMRKIFSDQYVCLHTLSHLLIRQIVQECGYAEASIKERIYSTYPNRDKQMAGILLYTSSSAADGSMGGLVRMADTDIIDKVFRNMIDAARWCSSDPLCIESTAQGFNSLNYAACHACALLPETCCESFNCLLDRAAVIGRHDKDCDFHGFLENINSNSLNEEVLSKDKTESDSVDPMGNILDFSFDDKGTIFSAASHDDYNSMIWDTIFYCCVDTTEAGKREKKLIQKIKTKMEGRFVNEDIYRTPVMVPDGNSDRGFQCTLCWPEKKVLYFSSDLEEAYHLACHCPNWQCFYGGDTNFPFNKFIKLIGE